MADSLNIDKLKLSDDERNAASKRERYQPAMNTPKTPANPNSARSNSNGATDDDDPGDAALRAELQVLQNMNRVIEGVVASLERAKANMSTVTRTVSHASTLLDTWTRILSQTEHNQRLILNPAWQGASQDLLDAESSTLQRQREREQREAEEVARREAVRAEEERKRVEAAARASAGQEGRGRGGSGSLRGRGRVPSSGYGRTVSGEAGRGSSRGRALGSGAGYGRVGSAGTVRGGVGRGARGRGLS